jgi:hypothetical protein
MNLFVLTSDFVLDIEGELPGPLKELSDWFSAQIEEIAKPFADPSRDKLLPVPGILRKVSMFILNFCRMSQLVRRHLGRLSWTLKKLSSSMSGIISMDGER